ncbi:MAG: hypothetical protein ACHQM6_07155 [Candidatus Kapaibacterium sp.]
MSRKIFFILFASCGLFFAAGCSDSTAPGANIHISEIARYSIRSHFRIESSGSYPDSLAPLFPNPFNRTIGDSVITIFFTTKDTGEVKIVIQNPLGDSVAIFRDSVVPPGIGIGSWQPVTANGTRLRPGLYFITMHAAPDDPDRNYINSRLLQIQSND